MFQPALEQEITRKKQQHESFLRALEQIVPDYWWNHRYFSRWGVANQLVVENSAYLLNKIMTDIGEATEHFKDTTSPEHIRCSICNKFIKRKEVRDHKSSSQSCNSMVEIPIESLCSGWVPNTQPDLTPIKGLSHIPEHVTLVNMLSFIEQAAAVKLELIAKNIAVNLQSVCKGVFTSPSKLANIPVGFQSLIMNILTIANSEAIAETYGSMMESYHKERFFNTGESNEDSRCQREFFCRANGPPIGHSVTLCLAVARRLTEGVPYTDGRMQPPPNNHLPAVRKFRFPSDRYARAAPSIRKTMASQVINRKLSGDKKNRLGVLENF